MATNELFVNFRDVKVVARKKCLADVSDLQFISVNSAGLLYMFITGLLCSLGLYDTLCLIA